MIIVGAISGTSADGIDVAIVEIVENETKLDIELISFETIQYKEESKIDTVREILRR